MSNGSERIPEHPAAPVVIEVDGDPLEIPAFLRDWLAEAWDEGHGTSNGGCVYWPDCAENGHHVNPYRAAS